MLATRRLEFITKQAYQDLGMRRWWLIFGFLLALCLVLGAVLLMPGSEGKHGLPHPRISSMLIGGDVSRHGGVIWLAWLYGSLQIGLFVTTLTLGLRQRRTGLGTIAAIGLALAGVFTSMMLVYAKHQLDASPHLWLGFPPSTALMLFALWPLPTVFIVLYVVQFDRWFLAPQDLENFTQLVKAEGRKD
jgi:hypothetical protein